MIYVALLLVANERLFFLWCTDDGAKYNQLKLIQKQLVVAAPDVSSRQQRAVALALDHPLIYAFAQPLSKGASIADFLVRHS